MTQLEPITFDEFAAVDIRVGTIVGAEVAKGLNKPALILTIDFGAELGRRRSSAQITHHYQPDDLLGTQVAAVINFPPRQVGKYMSEVLVLAVPSDDGEPVLWRPDSPVPDGGRLY